MRTIAEPRLHIISTLRFACHGPLAVLAGCLLGASLASAPIIARADGNYESVAFGVRDYAGVGTCSNTELPWAEDTVRAWRDKMANAVSGPGYDAMLSQVYYNYNVDPEDFVDILSDETATTGVDWADVAFFNGHGNSTCGIGPTSYTSLSTGDDDGIDCVVTLGTDMNEMVLGGGATGSDLNMFFMHASKSLRWCVVEDGIIFEVDGGGSGSQFSLLAGFHNSPWSESSNDNEVEGYIGNSINNGIGENYIYQLAHGQGDQDRECTSMVITSSSLSNANNLFFYGGFSDFKDTGTHNQHWYYSNCGDTCGDNAACQ